MLEIESLRKIHGHVCKQLTNHSSSATEREIAEMISTGIGSRGW